MVPVQWAAFNSAALLGLGGYLWRQSRKIDVLYQAFFGVNGRNGLLRRLDDVMADAKTVDQRITETRHQIRNEFQTALLQLHDEIDKRLDQKQGKP